MNLWLQLEAGSESRKTKRKKSYRFFSIGSHHCRVRKCFSVFIKVYYKCEYIPENNCYTAWDISRQIPSKFIEQIFPGKQWSCRALTLRSGIEIPAWNDFSSLELFVCSARPPWLQSLQFPNESDMISSDYRSINDRLFEDNLFHMRPFLTMPLFVWFSRLRWSDCRNRVESWIQLVDY